MTTIDRPTSTTAARAAQPPSAAGVAVVLHERHRTHLAAGRDEPPAGASQAIAELRALAERCGATASEQHSCTATNIARSYYDGGHDVEVSCALTVSFESAEPAARFVAAAAPSIVDRLARGRSQAATLRVDGDEFVLDGAPALRLARALLERVSAGERAARCS